jgi:hypothetical protein
VKLHTRLTRDQVRSCLDQAKDSGKVAQDVGFISFEYEASRARPAGWLVYLGSDDRWVRTENGIHKRRRSQKDFNYYAATYDEWGWFIAEIFAADETAIFGTYKSPAHFHMETGNKFTPEGKVNIAVETIDLGAEGIDQDTYLACLAAIAEECNRIRQRHGWCWVWLKFATVLSPSIVRGEKLEGSNTWKVRVRAPEEVQLHPREWFTDAGWAKYTVNDQDTVRIKELRDTYGRILQIVRDGHITLEEAQRVFRVAHLPAYTGNKDGWKGTVNVGLYRDLAVEDITATQEQFNAAWKDFLAAVGHADDWGRGRDALKFEEANGGQPELQDKDMVALLGNPMRNYDPMIAPNGDRIYG